MALKYDWKIIQKYYDLGHTWKDITEKFGVSKTSIGKASKAGRFQSRTRMETINFNKVSNMPLYLDAIKRKERYIIKICDKHGETKFILENRGYYRCVKCRLKRSYNYCHNLKQKALEYKGGKCNKCGYNKCTNSLTFHHLDPSKKEFGLSVRKLKKSWGKIKFELDKCVLLCANCHMEIHEELELNKQHSEVV